MTSEPVCVEEFQPYLRRKVSGLWWEYFQSGAGSEQTLRDNTLAYQRYRLRPRCLRDVSKLDTATSILGYHLDFPVGVAPTAYHGIVHPEGEIATAQGVASVGSAMVLSMMSNRRLEDVAAAVPSNACLFQQLTFQCYGNSVDRKIRLIESLVRRAEAACCRAIVVTLDHPVPRKTLAQLNPAVEFPHITFPQFLTPGDSLQQSHMQCDFSVTWDNIKWLQSLTSLPIIAKGILTAEDAKEAVKYGVAGIVVSNHGGRHLNAVSSTIDALPEVVNAVRGSNVEVYLDGGIRRGTDVLKALALGARAVFIGRPAIWGLAYDGKAGVRKILQIIKEELSEAMALTGCSSIADITRDLVAMPSYSKL